MTPSKSATSKEKPKLIGDIRFVDRADRKVFEDDRGQFVVDDEGQPVYGVWIWVDEPVVVKK